MPILAILSVFVAYVAFGLFVAPTGTYAGTSTFTSPASQHQVSNLQWPQYGQAAIGTLEAGVLSMHGNQSSAPTASIAKVMTALCILKERPLAPGQQGPTITLGQADVDLYNEYVAKDGSVARVAAGEEITEYQALQAMMLPSANNMADSMALWAFGSMDAYTTYANNYAHELGMAATVLADASGFSPATVSSAQDLVILGQTALQNPVLADIVAQPSAVIPVAGTIRNVNTLLEAGHGFIGIKTGNTDQAGGCLLWAARKQVGERTVTVIGVIMGAPKRVTALADSVSLLDSFTSELSERTIATAGTTVGYYQVPWGEKVAVVTRQNISILAWKGSDISSRLILNDLSAPARRGQTVGKIIIEGSAVSADASSTPLVLARSITTPDLWWRLQHPVDSWRLHFGSVLRLALLPR